MQPLNSPAPSTFHPSPAPLLEVFIHSQFYPTLQDGIRIRVVRPRKGHAIAERLVPPRQRGVDDVLPVPDDRDEPAIGRVDEGRGKDLSRSHLLDGDRYPHPLRGRVVLHHLQICGEHLLVFGIDELAGRIHAESRFVATELRQMSEW